MKKSEIYNLAQCTVLNSGLRNETKLEVLRELMSQEDLAIFCEEQEVKREAQDEAV